MNTVDNPTNAKDKEGSDVMMDIRTIDEKFSDVDELPIIFVAIKIKNLPDRGDISELSVRNRLSILEAQMSEILADRATHTATGRTEIAMYAATAHDGHMLPVVNQTGTLLAIIYPLWTIVDEHLGYYQMRGTPLLRRSIYRMMQQRV